MSRQDALAATNGRIEFKFWVTCAGGIPRMWKMINGKVRREHWGLVIITKSDITTGIY